VEKFSEGSVLSVEEMGDSLWEDCLNKQTVFCKYFFPKVAKYFSIVLQQEFPQCCKPYFAKLLVHCRQ